MTALLRRTAAFTLAMVAVVLSEVTLGVATAAEWINVEDE